MDKKTVRKLLNSEIEHSANETELAAKRQIRVIAASGRADRVGDIVKVDGIELQNYKKNPVVLYGHDSMSLPIAKAVEMGVEGGKLMMTFEFADAETYAFADTVYKLVKGGFIKGVSIGARVLQAEWIKDKADNIVGRQYNRLELLEVSVVAIPADSKALITAVKSGAVSEQEFEDYLSKSFDGALDSQEEKEVQEKNVGVSTEPTEDEEAMKEQIAALEKRLEALETALKAQTTAHETSAKAMEGITAMFAALGTQIGNRQTPDLAALSRAAGSVDGPAGDVAKQMFGMVEGMLKRLSPR